MMAVRAPRQSRRQLAKPRDMTSSTALAGDGGRRNFLNGGVADKWGIRSAAVRLRLSRDQKNASSKYRGAHLKIWKPGLSSN